VCLYVHKLVRERIHLNLVGRFKVTGAPPAAKRIQVLPMNQYASWPITFGIKGNMIKSVVFGTDGDHCETCA
jgi:hypothetical protein